MKNNYASFEKRVALLRHANIKMLCEINKKEHQDHQGYSVSRP